VLAGLEHAHACGVIHRDLKPENILVAQELDGHESIKLVDFGIAKIVGAMPGSGSGVVGVIFGTPQYMSPEQAAGRPVDYRSDVYAAGVLLYAMLAGRRPFDDDDPRVVLDQQIHASPPPLPETVPAALRQITMRMLHKDPARRFPSAARAISALEAAEHAAAPRERSRRRGTTTIAAGAPARGSSPRHLPGKSPRGRLP
jgi:serine/threonine protein kinase